MIRRADEPSLRENPPLPRATPEMLERRRKFLADSFGAWADQDGERVARWIEETFESAEPIRAEPDE